MLLGVEGGLAGLWGRARTLAPVAAVRKEYLERYHGMVTLKALIDTIFLRLLFYRRGN